MSQSLDISTMGEPSGKKRIAYQIDGLVLSMFAASIFDVVTTYLGLTRLPAVEANPVLGPLLQHSMYWLPVYCFVRPLLVPLLPSKVRHTFCVYYLLAHLYGGLNNSAMLYHSFSFVELLGYWLPLAVLGSGIVLFFLCNLFRHSENRWSIIRGTLSTLVVFSLIEGVFYFVGEYLLAES